VTKTLQAPTTPSTRSGTTDVPTRSGTTDSKIDATFSNPIKATSITGLFYDIVDFVVGLSYVVVAFFLLLSGFKFITAQGSPDKLSEARRTFFGTIVGAIIVVGINVIAKVVETTINSLRS
jgi:hypothetical protein